MTDFKDSQGFIDGLIFSVLIGWPVSLIIMFGYTLLLMVLEGAKYAL